MGETRGNFLFLDITRRHTEWDFVPFQEKYLLVTSNCNVTSIVFNLFLCEENCKESLLNIDLTKSLLFFLIVAQGKSRYLQSNIVLPSPPHPPPPPKGQYLLIAYSDIQTWKLLFLLSRKKIKKCGTYSMFYVAIQTPFSG